MHELAKRLWQTIRKQGLIRAGDRVAAAVSGGADSVALLCLLLELRADLGIVLSVAHINHKLRGEESDEDERFVVQLARQHQLEIRSCDAPIDGSAGSGIEAAARELRYGFFRRLAREGGVKKTATKIATAHTLDDQAETVLMRIFRGTGIRGLSGVHPRVVFQEDGQEAGQEAEKDQGQGLEKDLEKDRGLAFGEVVRPLLGFRRGELLEFLRAQGQSWREDSSNQDIAFLRNHVRHRLLPIIAEEFGDAAIEHLSELAEIARAEEEHWELGHPDLREKLRADLQGKLLAQRGTADDDKRQAASLQVRSLLALPLAMQRRLVRAWLEANAPDLKISFRLIEEALHLAGAAAAGKQVGRKIEMGSGWNLRRGRQELLLEFADAVNKGSGQDCEGLDHDRSRNQKKDYQYRLAVPGAVEVEELRARIEARVIDVVGVPEQEREHLLNIELMPAEVLIRNWRPGDRYWPAHTSAKKKVKELLSDRHAVGTQKKLWPVAAAEGYGLVWMRGFAVPAAFRAPAGASKAIWIREVAG